MSTLYDLLAYAVSLDEIAYPVSLMYRDVKVNILEISKVKTQWSNDYLVVVQLTDGEHTSKPFTIPCKDTLDFVRKLRIEIMKFKALKVILLPHEVKSIFR